MHMCQGKHMSHSNTSDRSEFPYMEAILVVEDFVVICVYFHMYMYIDNTCSWN